MWAGIPGDFRSTGLAKNFQILFRFAWKFREKSRTVPGLVETECRRGLHPECSTSEYQSGPWGFLPLQYLTQSNVEYDVKPLTKHQIRLTLRLKIAWKTLNTWRVYLTLMIYDFTSGILQRFQKCAWNICYNLITLTRALAKINIKQQQWEKDDFAVFFAFDERISS